MSDFWLWDDVDDHHDHGHDDHDTERVAWVIDDLLNSRHVRTLLHVAHELLGHDAFEAGFCYGLGVAAAQSIATLGELYRVFLLAGVFEVLFKNTARAHLFRTFGSTPLFLAARIIGHNSATYLYLEAAHEQREAMIAEVREVMSHLDDVVLDLPEHLRAEYEDKWRRIEELNRHAGSAERFEAGKYLGEVIGELALTLGGLIALGVGTARLAARAPRLLRIARDLARNGADDFTRIAAVETATEAPTALQASRAVEGKPVVDPIERKPPAGERAHALALRGVTFEEHSLARSSGASPAQVRARSKIAQQFYREHGGGMSEKDIASHVKGIDTSKPVTAGPPPPAPEVQHQWQVPGARQGNYYADHGTAPTNIGINSRGRGMGPDGWGSGPIESKVSRPYEVPKDTPYLESTAAPYLDKHSVADMPTMTEGGGTQRYMPALKNLNKAN